MMKWCITTLILILAGLVVSLEQCRPSVLQKCRCGYTIYDRERRYVVNCTSTGFRSTDMLENLPPHTEVLIFTGNYIPELPWNIFGEINNLTNLSIIDMSYNGIREIKGKSYHHVPNVRRLILNHNNLTISDDDDHFHHPRVFSNFINLQELHLTNAFLDNTDSALANDLHDIFVNSNLSLLNKLHLEQNEIRSFRDRNVFCDLPSLMDLHLGDNFLTGLTFNISCLRHLRYLDLERNNISRLTAQEFAELDKMSYPIRKRQLIIDISSNPFVCNSENTRMLYKWIQTTNVTVRDQDGLWCLRGRSRGAVSLKRLFGDTPDHTTASKAITVVLIVLAVILILLLAALAYLSKERISSRFRPLFDIMSRKVHYTTIESQDV